MKKPVPANLASFAAAASTHFVAMQDGYGKHFYRLTNPILF